MLKLVISRTTDIERDKIFSISVNIEQFSKLMPKYFKSLQITNKINSEYFVDEEISFFTKSIWIQTKHIVKNPDIHEIHILSGPLKNSSFIETYQSLIKGTKVTIIVTLKFNGIFKFLYIFKPLIENRINKIMDEFISACEQKIKQDQIIKLALVNYNANCINTNCQIN